MEQTIDTLFGNTSFLSIYFVDENPAKIETVEVKKVNNEIKEIRDARFFNLKKHSIEKSGLPSLKVRENVKHDLIVRLNFASEVSEMRYFNVGFFKKFFYQKDPKKLVEKFNQKDWIITSEEIVSELCKLNDFVYLPGYGDIRIVGKIGQTMVFKMKDIEGIIYAGDKDSLTAVFNRSLLYEENELNVEYLIQTNGGLTKILVH